ncbi:MAG: PLP-dependent aminotransferase family protein [Bacteroidales bacterium]|nr:PLP-dependent aminotransferase family protein [Bacteroidales bacterium]
MINNIESLWSEKVNSMKKSVIRELLKLTQKEGIISFAGGLPDPALFPVDDLSKCTEYVLQTHGSKALQYGLTEGDLGLRKELATRYRQIEGLNIDENNIVITTASQQGLDLVGRVFLDKGDVVMCALPSYLGGINAFSSYGAEIKGVKLDENGMSATALDDEINKTKAEGKKVKFIYLVPDFQNPAGITMNRQRRLDILDIAYKHNLPIIEDSPYREVRFDGEPQEMFQSLDKKGFVITLGSLSKVLAPGFRIGWAMGDPIFLDKIVTVKQVADLCSSSFVQMIAAEYFRQGYYAENIKKIIKAYREKRDAMLGALEEFMPEGVTWTHPEGGLFLFVILPKNMNSEALFEKAIERNVAFVIGNVFHCDNSGKNTMRINFSFSSIEDNIEGVRRLSEVIKEMM